MDILDIPFVEKIGISRSDNGTLGLDFSRSVLNHIATIHAGAQYSLAETASGGRLQELFPELVGKAAPVLRDAQIKFKKPATQNISAFSSVTDDAVQKFKEQYRRKGRSSIAINVEIRDTSGIVTATGVFNWFVQSMAKEAS